MQEKNDVRHVAQDVTLEYSPIGTRVGLMPCSNGMSELQSLGMIRDDNGGGPGPAEDLTGGGGIVDVVLVGFDDEVGISVGTLGLNTWDADP